MKTKALPTLFFYTLLATTKASLADCPTQGVPILVRQDGPVTATFVGTDSPLFFDELFLDSPSNGDPKVIFDSQTTATGTQVVLGTFKAGTELVFRLLATTASGTFNFYSGPAYRNPDEKPHALVNEQYSPTETFVGFEDWYNNPQCDPNTTDYNPAVAFTDIQFVFTNIQRGVSPDSFISYKTRPAKGSSVFQPITLSLTDIFETGTFRVRKSKTLAVPTSLDGSSINTPDQYLQGFVISNGPKHQHRKVQVKTELGLFTLGTKNATRIVVPTVENPTGSTSLPHAEFGPYKCYATTNATPRLPKVEKTITNRFQTLSKNIVIRKPNALCAPVQINGAAIASDASYLMCYRFTTPKGQPRHQRLSGLSLINNLATSNINVLKDKEVCFPATVTPQ